MGGRRDQRFGHLGSCPDHAVASPRGFDGLMDLPLDLAERQRTDFGRMSILV
jgi:hypothetical protein